MIVDVLYFWSMYASEDGAMMSFVPLFAAAATVDALVAPQYSATVEGATVELRIESQPIAVLPYLSTSCCAHVMKLA